MRYSAFIVKYFWLIIVLTVVVSTLCIVLAVIFKDLPDFNDPVKGFEARGTEIRGRQDALVNLASVIENRRLPYSIFVDQKNFNHNELLFGKLEPDYITEDEDFAEDYGDYVTDSRRRRRRSLHGWRGAEGGESYFHGRRGFEGGELIQDARGYVAEDGRRNLGQGRINGEEGGESNHRGNELTWNNFRSIVRRHKALQGGGFKENGVHFDSHTRIRRSQTSYKKCTERWFGGGYNVKLAFKSVNRGESLWRAEAVREMCEMDERLVLGSPHVNLHDGEVCPSHSIGYYIGLLNNKECRDITNEDMNTTSQLLDTCASLYDLALDGMDICAMCVQEGRFSNGSELCVFCATMIKDVRCLQDDAIFRILHYLTDYRFEGSSSHLTYASMILDLQWNANEDFYKDEIHSGDLKGQYVEIIGIDVLDRFGLFASYLLQDMVYFIVAMLLIFVIAGLYTKSLIIIVFTLFNVIFSFGLAYFMYYIVFQIPHMPFMSFLAILLLIAIGADDVFIFCDTFEYVKAANPNGNLVDWISKTMHHAAMSILVTSLTTAAALYANVISEITDIRGFGILSGTALVANYLLMITWIPAGLVVLEKVKVFCKKVRCHEPKCIEMVHMFLTVITAKVFHEFLPYCVKKLWLLWIILFLGLGVGGIVVTFVKPKLDLPTSQDFALFDRDSTIEVWFQELKYEFRYYRQQTEQSMSSGLRLVTIWGVKGEDTGNYLDPDSDSYFELDDSFDMSHPDAQIWLLKFCKDTKNVSFVNKEFRDYQDCTLDLFNSFIMQSCDVLQTDLQTRLPDLTLTDLNITDCCGYSSYPIPQDKFHKCFYHFYAIYFTLLNRYHLDLVLGRALWDLRSRKIVAFEYGFVGSQGYTSNYAIMDPYYRETQDYMKEKLKSAPGGLKNGWLSPQSNLGLYDLQRSLAFGTYAAIGVSMAASFLVMFVTSLNIIITFYAILTIFLTISVCAGILVLLGWELNIVESVTLTMSVGLSIDFCIHYGMGYRLSTLNIRKLRVQDSFEKVGSAIFMAAATTFIAGACIMPSIILFYVQLGTFLMLVMAMSWLFATFFFQSLCHVLGPQGDFAQIPSPLKLLSRRRESVNRPKPQVEPVIPPTLNNEISTIKENNLVSNGDTLKGTTNPAFDS